jgi:outer membrane protein insertion porin family
MRPTRALTLILTLATAAAHAQYTVGSVAYKGGAPYADAELSAVAGLQPGQMMATDGLGTAAQHLLDTGLFDDVQATYTQQGKALHITFQLKPLPPAKLLTVSLENFPWFTPEELTAALHQQLPLYHGLSSDAGTFSDSIQDALTQILTTKGVTAKLSHTIVEPTTLHPIRTVNFRIDAPAVRLMSIDITSPIPAALQTDTYKAITAATGKPLNEGLTGRTLQDVLLLPARDAGYITASLKDIHNTVTPAPRGFDVAITATLDAGEPYKVAALNYTPTPLYAAADLARDAQLHPGDLARSSLLLKTETPIQNAWLKQGYLDAYITASPIRDDTAHTVSYTLVAVPGEIYHLKTVTATGLGPAAQKAFDEAWTMKPGDLYDATYIVGFIKKNIAQEVFRPYTFGYRAVGDPQTHLVDMTLTFSPAR